MISMARRTFINAARLTVRVFLSGTIFVANKVIGDWVEQVHGCHEMSTAPASLAENYFHESFAGQYLKHINANTALTI